NLWLKRGSSDLYVFCYMLYALVYAVEVVAYVHDAWTDALTSGICSSSCMQ
ncbi:hypothetical protein A2U01_0036048, partial [Trifolium medium]|nr:hypothetical protein [Trifolium medium]